jgi:hypothetical protein
LTIRGARPETARRGDERYPRFVRKPCGPSITLSTKSWFPRIRGERPAKRSQPRPAAGRRRSLIVHGCRERDRRSTRGNCSHRPAGARRSWPGGRSDGAGLIWSALHASGGRSSHPHACTRRRNRRCGSVGARVDQARPGSPALAVSRSSARASGTVLLLVQIDSAMNGSSRRPGAARIDDGSSLGLGFLVAHRHYRGTI